MSKGSYGRFWPRFSVRHERTAQDRTARPFWHGSGARILRRLRGSVLRTGDRPGARPEHPPRVDDDHLPAAEVDGPRCSQDPQVPHVDVVREHETVEAGIDLDSGEQQLLERLKCRSGRRTAIQHQGRSRRRVPAPLRSRRHARRVRPHRPHGTRTTARRLRDAPSLPLCPYLAAAVELHDPQHPASRQARDYKTAISARLAATAREAGAVPGSSTTSPSPPRPPSPPSLIDNAIPTPAAGQSGDNRETFRTASVAV